MTISGWFFIIFICIAWCAIGCLVYFMYDGYHPQRVAKIIVVAVIALCAATYGVGRWYYTSTASGIRAVTDQKSELNNGIERTITVYTADGNVLAEYKGQIDVEMERDYVKFDWNGKRYIYYNCFVETIADIP